MSGAAAVTGDLTMTGHVIPSANITYDLGSTTKMWKDVYIGPGSLYVNGQKVIEDSSGTIVVSADVNQNLQIETTGTGDVSLSTAAGGKVEIGGTLEIASGKNITSSDGNAISFTDGLDMNGEAISNTSTVDGRDVATDGTKLDTIETNATADQTAAEIKTLYESNSDTNEFSDAEQTKLSGIETSADVTDTTNVVAALTAGTGITISGGGTIAAGPIALTTVQTAANQTAHLALTAEEGDIVVRSDENKTYCHNGGSAGTMADYTLLATPTDVVLSVAGNTGAVTAAQLKTAYESNSDTNEFSDAEQTKLSGIATSANLYVHPNHSGEVTSTADGATVIADNIVDEANLKISNSPTNGYFLSAQSGNTGGLTWAEVDALPSQSGNSGKFLTTDATNASWATVDALPSQSGNAGKYLTTDATNASWATLDTDANTTTKGLYEHEHTIDADYSIASGSNAMSAGPITIDTGNSVTVPSGSTWVIVQE